MSGYGTLLHLDSATRNFVEEFSTSAFLGHKKADDGRHVLVVPSSDNAMDSTTSRTMTDLAQREGWIIEKSLVSGFRRRTPLAHLLFETDKCTD
jgi:branched-chain amino acid aminotransferase